MDVRDRTDALTRMNFMVKYILKQCEIYFNFRLGISLYIRLLPEMNKKHRWLIK